MTTEAGAKAEANGLTGGAEAGVHPFAAGLLRWYAENGRDLPWRHTSDPYPIWLSEVILQQTRIEQGRDYWLRFVERWPRVEALAEASEDEVLRMWQGLGYYSRARNLHASAKQISTLGHFPDTFDEIKRLKGVGDYTAAAIASFAFGEPVAVVDGNVYRVLSRHFGISTPINTTEGKKDFFALASEMLPKKHAATYNQPSWTLALCAARQKIRRARVAHWPTLARRCTATRWIRCP